MSNDKSASTNVQSSDRNPLNTSNWKENKRVEERGPNINKCSIF